MPKNEESNSITDFLRERERIEKVIDKQFSEYTTIMFTDIVGYTTYTETYGDIEAKALLQKHNDILFPVIEQNKGTVIKTIGDAIMAHFEEPFDAVSSAIIMQTKLNDYNNQVSKKKRIHIRIGIHSGKAISADNDLFGDTVNIAARIEQKCQPDQILVSKSVYETLKDKENIHFYYHGKKTAKGKSKPLELYQVILGIDNTTLTIKAGYKITIILYRILSKTSLKTNIITTCFLMITLMPFVNNYKINLLTKIWQCQLTLVPNEDKVIVVTIDQDEHKKIITKSGKDQLFPFMDNPKSWRRYHSEIIKKLYNLKVSAVGFDLWFSPPFDEKNKQASKKFVEGLKWAKNKKFPIVLGQFQNIQDPDIYREVEWGYITVYKDLTWIDKVMYLKSWDEKDLLGIKVKKPAFFVQLLAKSLHLNPIIEHNGIKLIGKPIPKRLWIGFSKIPINTIPYHEVYNGWINEELFSGKIVLIGLGVTDTDYFRVPYSPTDFTPHNTEDSYGMPGVFLFAHAINQIMNGFYHAEVNDEWLWFFIAKWYSVEHLRNLFFLLVESVLTCLFLYFIYYITWKKERFKFTLTMMVIAATSVIIFLAITPVLLGLANFLFSSTIFIILSTKQHYNLQKFIKLKR